MHLVKDIVQRKGMWELVEGLIAEKLPDNLAKHVFGPRFIEVGSRYDIRAHIVIDDLVHLLGANLTCGLSVLLRADFTLNLDLLKLAVDQDALLSHLNADAIQFYL